MKNLIITISLVLCVNILDAQTLNKYHGGNADGYASATASKSSALPIILVNFNVTDNNGIVDIKWATSSEINSELFILQRSSDGIHFETINEQAAQGNSMIQTDYLYTDSVLDQTGTIYYKLLQKDMSEYAKSVGVKTININHDLVTPAINLYPNPANDNIILLAGNSSIQGVFTVNIYGMDGKIYYNGVYNNHGIDVSNFAEGIYILYSFGSNKQSLKFVVKH